jgi:diguanylate cyclase (GGDEF)-like protein
MERGQQEFARWKRHNEPASLIMLDADHFKKVNDTHGHEAGDQVLRQLADTARAQLRTEDVFARLGGEEFVVLAPDTSIQGAMELAERIRAEVEARHVPVKGGRLAFTISLGVAQTLEQDTDLEATLRRADLALYEAKENGRNQVRLG